MLGAIAGDIIGSVFEWNSRKDLDFPLFSAESVFTDDTVLTVAVAEAILDRRDYADALREFGNRYPGRGYGFRMHRWIRHPTMGPYHSWGNGSAMRVCPVGFAFDTEAEVLEEARRSAAVTHNHPDGIRGAQATALAVLLGRKGAGRTEIRSTIVRRFGYDLGRTVGEIRPGYDFDVSCAGSVPESLVCCLEAENFEGAVRNAISLGGDADTMACIAGGVAEACYGPLPEEIVREVRDRLPDEFLGILDRFRLKYVH
jgi:ADP-ribosylglycohydrolase